MLKPKLIMVVDDKKVVRDVLYTFLEKKGYETAALEDGQSAISYAKTKNPDLVLLDIKMPGLDGIETCLRLNQILNSSPTPGVFIITGYDCPDNIEKSYRSGAIDVIRKPFDLEDVDHRINAWFEVRNIKSKLLRQWVYTDKKNWYMQKNNQSIGTEYKNYITRL